MSGSPVQSNIMDGCFLQPATQFDIPCKENSMEQSGEPAFSASCSKLAVLDYVSSCIKSNDDVPVFETSHNDEYFLPKNNNSVRSGVIEEHFDSLLPQDDLITEYISNLTEVLQTLRREHVAERASLRS